MPMKKNSHYEKNLQRKIIETSLAGITEIKPLIHRTRFSGNFNYGEVKKALGKLKPDKEYRKKAVEKQYKYQKKSYRKLKGGTVVFLFKASAPYDDLKLRYLLPKCIVETSFSTPGFLSLLSRKLPNLKTMSIEYAIDFYCRDNDAVNDLFYLFRRYFYTPYAKELSMIDANFNGWKEARIINAVYRIYSKKKGYGDNSLNFLNKYIKIYERGEDGLKKTLSTGKKGWDHKDTDRVRVEVTINNKRGIFKEKGIDRLEGLLEGPKFQEILFPQSLSKKTRKLDQIQFRNFRDRSSNNLPKDYQDYNTEDVQGNIECFMNEYLNAKKEGINISRETEPTKALNRLKEKIIEATRKFDQKWEKKKKIRTSA